MKIKTGHSGRAQRKCLRFLQGTKVSEIVSSISPSDEQGTLRSVCNRKADLRRLASLALLARLLVSPHVLDAANFVAIACDDNGAIAWKRRKSSTHRFGDDNGRRYIAYTLKVKVHKLMRRVASHGRGPRSATYGKPTNER